MTLAKDDAQGTETKISRFDEDIVRFDSVLDRIQKLMPYDLKVYDKIVEARDKIFQLQQAMRGCEIVEFAAPWIEPADLFWNRQYDDQQEQEERK
jgi:hypothetical protein